MRSVLVTGGAGFWGKAFAKRLLDTDGAQRICIYSRNEWNQAQMRAALNNDERLRWFIGDVRDSERLKRAMDGVDVVVHAAALKRIEAVEENVMEAVSTNIIGTENVVKAAIDVGASRAILLSTDKAAAASTTYGLTKAVAEAIFRNAGAYVRDDQTRFAVCRYGNVWRSTGSIVQVWGRLLADGATEVPVTNPDCTRFFMTADQAVDLVLKAIEETKGGDVFVPDLPAYDLRSLAEAMGATGFRPMGMGRGEKIHERMTDEGPDSSQVRRMTVQELREALG
jgi:UDP-N-acetylglucosamine 4,6-dehydratase